jgi:hypothetical protein
MVPVPLNETTPFSPIGVITNNNGQNNTKINVIHSSIVENDEITVRKDSHHDHSLYMLVLNTYSSIFIFLYHLISPESVFSIILSVGLTVYTYYKTQDNDTFDGSVMSWTLLSFAVITPIGAAVTMAFSRRELALVNISLLRSLFVEIYTSHSVWGWDYTPGNTSVNGRAKVSTIYIYIYIYINHKIHFFWMII